MHRYGADCSAPAVLCATLIEKLCLQVVQESPTQVGGTQTFLVGFQQALAYRAVDRWRNRQYGLTGALDKAAARYALLQAQGIKHELETQFLPLHDTVFGKVAAVSPYRLLHPGGWVLDLGLPDDAIVKGKFAVGARAYTQIGTELPIIKVMATALARLGVGRHFVAFPAARRRGVGDEVLHH